jgi:rare lipoprotein A
MIRPRRDSLPLVAVLVTVAAACAPSAAAQSTGGATPGAAPAPAMPAPVAPAAPAPVTYGDPSTPSLLARPTGLLGRTVHLRGTLPGRAGQRVVVQLLDAQRGWRTAVTGRVRSSGRYLVRWRPTRPGRVQLRAVTADAAGRVRATDSAPALQLTVYRAERATLFGPGLYGRRTACGQELAAGMLGVAHRTLPCGTPVEISYGGRTVTVPVIDRGPFANGARWDLTEATAAMLAFEGAQTIGVAPNPSPPPAA